MVKTTNKTNNKMFADKIRMIAKSIYDAADDIAGTTDGCVDISVSFDIETEGFDTEFPKYTIVRRHYPQKDIVDEFFKKLSDTSETEEKHIGSNPVVYKEMLNAEIERAKTAALSPTHVTMTHTEALLLLGKCCATCKYSNDIENPICDGCIHGDHVYDRETRECWEDYDE